MIIDFTRNFTDKEYDRYWDVFERWWVQHDHNRRYMECSEWELDDPDSDIVECPEDWDTLIKYEFISDDQYEVKRDELLWLDDLQDTFNDRIHFLQKEGGFTEVLRWEGSCTGIETLNWLERKNVSYWIVFAPHPNAADLFLMRSDDLFREFRISHFGYFPSDSDCLFLTNRCGWRGTERVERVDHTLLTNWLNENCEGKWIGRRFTATQINMLYFENDSDMILYNMRFLGDHGDI